MIRFIKDILDIKNLLGMVRAPVPTPEPVQPVNEMVLKGDSNLCRFIATFTGELVIEVEGSPPYHITHEASGNEVSIVVVANRETVITGNIDQFEITDNDTYYVAVNNSLNVLVINNNVKTLDLRNAIDLAGISMLPFGIEVLFANCTNYDLYMLSLSVVNNSPDGKVMWIDPTQQYSQELISTARYKGWNVYYL